MLLTNRWQNLAFFNIFTEESLVVGKPRSHFGSHYNINDQLRYKMGGVQSKRVTPKQSKQPKLTLISHQIQIQHAHQTKHSHGKPTSDQHNEANKENHSDNLSMSFSGSAIDGQETKSLIITPRFKSILQERTYKFQWNTLSPNALKYTICGTNAKISQEEGHPYQLIDAKPLPSQGIHEIVFRIVSYGSDCSIAFGITSEDELSSSCSCKSQHSVTYMSYPNGKADLVKFGRDTMLRKLERTNLGVEKAGDISFTADMNLKTLTIIRKQNQHQNQPKISKLSFQSCFENKELYFFVCMSSFGDQIELQ